ncbi:uncharacterized protein LOC126907833 [Daktulosphaira vitifoliae]|uniref:uncharacterized protein LOC126907833 n=1 Tax=Daktulosphaira vitifoliae TaxID=58002 RepID=UPI0021AA0794|nr:uncharacterized protein LOC126907833 [Daktulosphaira vitifoliae]XP_050545410.1 uncharacterized protein LOC126907833 [Daktulosphaira vitifoliae]
MFFHILSSIISISFIIHGVQSMGCIIKEDLDYHVLANKYYDLQQINTGCKKEEQLSRNEVHVLPPLTESRRDWKTLTDKVVEKIKKQYNNLKCSYIFSAYFHFQTIKYFLQNGNNIQSLLKEEQIQWLMFNEESVDMLASMWNVGIGDEINEIWYMHLYNDTLMNFIQIALLKGVDENFINNILLANDSVTQVLEKFTDKNCHQENKFNYKNKNSILFKKYIQLKSNPESIPLRLEIIASNKYQINDLIESNIKNGVFIEGNKYFSTNWLFLNNILNSIEITNYILESFQIQINGISISERLLNNFYEMQQSIHLSLFNRIKKIEDYIQGILNFFKAIFLRIVWKYFSYCNHLFHLHRTNDIKSIRATGFQIFGSLRKVLNKSHNVIINCLEDFVQFFDLRKDIDLLEIHKMIQDKNSNKKSGVDLIIEKIKSVLNNLFSNSFYINGEKEENLEFSAELERRLQTFCHVNHLNVIEENVNITVRYSVYNAKVFLAYLKRELNNISFNVIQSFLKFSRELKMENNKVEIHSTKHLSIANFVDLSKVSF